MFQIPDPTQIPDPYERLSWIVGSGLGLITAIQLIFSIRKDRRDTDQRRHREAREARQAQAKAGYALVDELFDDISAGPLLEQLDAGLKNSPNFTRRNSDAIQVADAFRRAFGSPVNDVAVDLTPARLKFDAVLYYLDRFERAIVTGITTFADVRPSFEYYSKILARFAPAIDAYARSIGDGHATAFLRRYPHWRTALPNHAA